MVRTQEYETAAVADVACEKRCVVAAVLAGLKVSHACRTPGAPMVDRWWTGGEGRTARMSTPNASKPTGEERPQQEGAWSRRRPPRRTLSLGGTGEACLRSCASVRDAAQQGREQVWAET